MFRALRARNYPDLWSGRLPILVTGKRRRALRAVFCGSLVVVQQQRVAYHTAHQQQAPSHLLPYCLSSVLRLRNKNSTM